MPTVQRASGIRVTAPSTYAVADQPPRRDRRRRPLPPVDRPPLEDALIASLGELELEHVDTVPLVPTKRPSDPIARRSNRAAKIPSTQEVSFEAALGPGEQAVALVEQDGLYTWAFGQIEEEPLAQPRRRGQPSPPPTRTVRFTVPVHASSSKQRRSRLPGLDIVFRPIKALFFKFTSTVVLGQVVKRFEDKLARGLVHISSEDPQKWDRIDDAAAIRLPANRPARVLLMIHGTFSSTVGGFGSLGGTQWGQEFLRDALDSYDAILGFDHLTLSEDPVDNAEDLMAALRALNATHPVRFDSVTHSRGGLVYRSLVELLAPAADWEADFGKAVFVGATNGGTELADPENWQRLVDLYTNLAIASLKGLTAFAPQTALVTSVLGGVLKGVAALVKAMAVATIDERQVPGLAAMDPDGEFVTRINRTQPGQPSPGAIEYFAVVSNFEPDESNGETSLPTKLTRSLIDGLVDQLLGEDNDLVVNTAAMTSVDPHVGGFIADVLDFGANGNVYHTNYFHQRAVARTLRRWLNLGIPAARLPGGVPDGLAGTTASTALPPRVEDDFLLVDADASSEKAIRILDEYPTEFVIVRRADAGATYHYAFRPEELGAALRPGVTVRASLDLHEYLASAEVPVWQAAHYAPSQPGTFRRHPSAARGVVMEGNEPVGVLPNEDEMLMEAAVEAGPPDAAPPEAIPRPPPPTRRRATRHVGGSGGRARRAHRNGGGDLSEPQKVRNFFRAQMEREVLLGQPSTVEVKISREQLQVAAGRTGGAEAAHVDMKRKVVVQVIPRQNFELLDGGREEIDPILPGGDPVDLYFDVQPTHAGEGRIDVVVRQGQVPLLTLDLRPAIVAERSPGLRTLARADGAVADAPDAAGPVHQLSIYEDLQGDQVRLTFVFDSPELNVRQRAKTDYLPAKSISDYMDSRYREIEDYWARDKGETKAFTTHLRAVGMKLFEDLVPMAIQRLLWKHRSKLDSIQVISSEPFVPWELVHLKEPGGVGGQKEWFLGQLGLVRWLENLPDNGYPPTEIGVRKALAIVPDYPDGSGWELEEPKHEYEFVKDLFEAKKVRPDFNVLVELLGKPGSFDLLHYAGHGAAAVADPSDAQLILAVIDQDGQWVERSLGALHVEQFADLASNGKRPIVVLNACQVGRLDRKLAGIGGFAKAFLRRGAGVFVSSLWAVGDEPARTFVETFYEDLVSGSTMARATVTARLQAREAGDATWLAYTVYANPHARLLVSR